MNVFILKSVVDRNIPLEAIFRGVSGFLVADLVILWLLFGLPGFALYLPTNAF